MPQPFVPPVVFGVLNVTPDSFSDGGRFLDPAAAIGHGQALVEAGADVVDVGGESTRPGAAPVDPGEELRRVLPVVEGLVAGGIRVSIDTRRASVAAAAVRAGATIVNDVDGGRDPGLLRVAADSGADLVLMHSRGPAGRGGDYGDVVRDVATDLRDRVDAATTAGVPRQRLVVDPGVGFSKTAAENWHLLAHLDALGVDGLRLLVGVSRKRFLGELVDGPAEDRDGVTAVLTALLAERGVWGVRVHAPAVSRAAIDVVRRMREAA
ncbi:dihydropteroate synthase [Amnibacterium kyonggiense]|uniref:Dihydropteroate synthase n=1 Tax=Amnibacterium kyonggiense TaxID=595671 RepID=A0A4R7FQ44_9MICO|nr:dihydropteroate synthase [Amnibacterium kyonggiense]TDS79897.1 dihydropteroate synthase [Amnibacterium kyonggiense]